MVRLRYAKGEAEISGTAAELRLLVASIHAFLHSPLNEIAVQADTDFGPAPYEHAPHALRLVKTSRLLIAQYAPTELQILSSPQGLGLLADNLLAQAQEDPAPLSHVHFDAISWPEIIDNNSAELVLRCIPCR